jgi:hypothetical protein
MTTAAAPPAPALDEFPVLLRVPDLNVPLWGVTTAPVESPKPASLKGDGSFQTALAASVMSPASVSTGATDSPGSSAQDIAERKPAGAVNLVNVLQPWVTYVKATGADIAKWPLMKQIAAGALVSGVVLTGMMLFRGDSEKNSRELTASPTSFDMPRIEVPTTSPIAVQPVQPSHQQLEPSPVDARSLPAPRVADNTWNRGPAPSTVTPAENSTLKPQTRVLPTDRPVPPSDRDSFQFNHVRQTTGPEFSQPAAPPPDDQQGWRFSSGGQQESAARPAYPATDPITFPAIGQSPPDANRPSVARLEGITFPPRR